MVNPGDAILTSEPSYLGALQSFCSYRAKIIGIAYNPDVEKFKQAYEEQIACCDTPIRFIYTIPDFQNPSGETLPLSHRKALAEIAEEHDLVIIEDAPYRELRYEGEQIPTIYSLAPDRVLHLGSFSKIMAPGFRLGWIFGNPEILDKIYVCKQSLDLCPPVFDQYVAAEFLTSGKLDANLQNSIKLYRRKRDLMLSLLAEYMPEGVTWTHPDGGLFLFLTLPEGFEAVKFYDVALDRGVAYVAGQFFHTDQSRGKNTMRMNFSFMTEEKITNGIKLLAQLLREELQSR
jgi:2-aminoadipate transaminase